MSWSAHDRQINGGRRFRYLFMFTFSLISDTFLHSSGPASWTQPLAPGSDHTFVSSRKTSADEEGEETGSMARDVEGRMCWEEEEGTQQTLCIFFFWGHRLGWNEDRLRECVCNACDYDCKKYLRVQSQPGIWEGSSNVRWILSVSNS